MFLVGGVRKVPLFRTCLSALRRKPFYNQECRNLENGNFLLQQYKSVVIGRDNNYSQDKRVGGWSWRVVMDKFNETVRKYGRLALSVHVSVFLTTWTGFYVVICNGLDGDNLLHVMHNYLPILKEVNIHPEWGKLGLAYTATAFSGPLRYAVTIFGTPVIHKYLYQTE